MKNTTRMVVTAAIAATAIAAAAGTASAAQAPQVPDFNTISTDIAPGVHYTGNAADHSAVIATPWGTLSSAGAAFQVQDASGKTVLGAPVGPIKAATTVPAAPIAASAKHVDAPAPHDPSADFNTALGVAGTQFGLATGIGGMVGGVAGVVVGCPIGAVTGGLTVVPAAIPTLGAAELPGMALGCIVGAGTFGSIGAIVGGAAVGIPVGIASAVQAYNTLHAQGDV